MRKEDKLLLLGMVFGDGHVRYDRPELQIVYGVAQLELLKYKVEIVSRIVGYKINISKSEANYRFSVQNPYFKFLRKWCYYANGDRRFAKQVLNRLTLQAIAIWYMDDGSLRLS